MRVVLHTHTMFQTPSTHTPPSHQRDWKEKKERKKGGGGGGGGGVREREKNGRRDHRLVKNNTLLQGHAESRPRWLSLIKLKAR